MVNFDDTKRLLCKISVTPNKKLGQNFMINDFIIDKSIEYAQLVANENVIEVGPGCGNLTKALVNSKVFVFAVEKDRALFEYVRDNFHVDIIHADAIDFPIANYDTNRGDYKIVANLPYAISSVWLDKILSLKKQPSRMVLLVQKEAADRWSSGSCAKSFCPIGIFLQSIYSVDSKTIVPKRCFLPQPKVDSVLICLVKKEIPFYFENGCKQMIRNVFMHRRKQIGSVCNMLGMKILDQFLVDNCIDKRTRAEEIGIYVWQKFQLYCNKLLI